jgi:hypothetical protein
MCVDVAAYAVGVGVVKWIKCFNDLIIYDTRA